MNKKDKIKLKIVIVINIILVLMWMLVIFKFSSANGEKSDHTSGTTLEYIVRLFNKNLDSNSLSIVVSKYNVVIRKVAHFSIYALGGILIYLMYNNINKLCIKKIKYLKIFSFLTGIIYALSDEIHQYFVPGRSCEIKDVILDSTGVIFGIIIIFFILKCIGNKKISKIYFS